MVPPHSPAETLCDQHGTALYLCALVVTGDHDRALEAAADSIARVCLRPALAHLADHPATRRHLARLVFERCRQPASAPSVPPHGAEASFDELVARLARISRHERGALALCVYGGHSASQAAAVLGISDDTTHHLLTWGLRDLAWLAGDRGADTEPTRHAGAEPGAGAHRLGVVE